jgi:hypothetical protein
MLNYYPCLTCFTQDQGDEDFVDPPSPNCDKLELVHYEETEFYVLPFSLYALGLR